ncbi:MAG: hypothetical protein ACM3YM_06170 [Sphingomonadales bacterium]
MTALSAAAPAEAASARGEAGAIIRSGVTASASTKPKAPLVDVAGAGAAPQLHEVLRPCRPGDPAATQTCRLVLVEMQ